MFHYFNFDFSYPCLMGRMFVISGSVLVNGILLFFR